MPYIPLTHALHLGVLFAGIAVLRVTGRSVAVRPLLLGIAATLAYWRTTGLSRANVGLVRSQRAGSTAPTFATIVALCLRLDAAGQPTGAVTLYRQWRLPCCI